MRGAVSGEPFRGPGSDPGRGKSQDQLDLSHSSGHSDASSGGRSSSRSGSSNPLKMFQLCFTPSRPTTSPTRTGDPRSDYSLGTDSSSQRQGSTKSLYGVSDHSTRSQPGGTTFSIADIRKATRNFSPDYKIGQGGFGSVYRGRLQDGTFVAIKRAKKTVYDRHLTIEFNSEISTLSQIEHLNLVRFIGYLEYEDERIVVVEYVPNGTLREHLDGMRGNFLDLAARLDIAIDVSHAITYLHMYADNPIIHRDIKSSNILLTENLRAKVADFGFARLGSTETGVTHVSTQVKGTAGYLDPEYLRTYQLTDKSDVYSFGVLLVELITGRRPIETKRQIKERITVKWAMKMFMDGKAMQVLDPNLPQDPATNLALEKTLELALQCLAPTKQGRPSMRRCAEVLWSIRKDYRELLSSDTLSQFSNSRRSNSVREES